MEGLDLADLMCNYDALIEKLVKDGYVKYYSNINTDCWYKDKNILEVKHDNHCIVIEVKLSVNDYLI